MLEEKVDSLLALIKDLIDLANGLKDKVLASALSKAAFCLESKDLIGFKIISISITDSIKGNNLNDLRFIKLRKEVLEKSNLLREEFDKDTVPLTQAEELFLNLSYNKFFDIRDEIYTRAFWNQSPEYRFQKISRAFAIYAEILNHQPFKGILKWMSIHRPPMESEISGPLFKFIRNVLAHFPFFDTWDEIWISKELANWEKPNQSIDRFLSEFSGKSQVEYRFKENDKEGFTYVKINFPENYDNNKIYIKDIIPEEEGVKFALAMMLKVLYTQIESIK